MLDKVYSKNLNLGVLRPIKKTVFNPSKIFINKILIIYNYTHGEN